MLLRRLGMLLWRGGPGLRRGGLAFFLASLMLCVYRRSEKQEDRKGPR